MSREKQYCAHDLLRDLTTKYYLLSGDGVSMSVICSKRDKYVAVFLDSKEKFETSEGYRVAEGFRTLEQLSKDVCDNDQHRKHRVAVHRLLSKRSYSVRTFLGELVECQLSKRRTAGRVCDQCEMYAKALDKLRAYSDYPSRVKLTPPMVDCKQCVSNWKRIQELRSKQYERLQDDCRRYPTDRCLEQGGIKQNLEVSQRQTKRYEKAQNMIESQWSRAPAIR